MHWEVRFRQLAETQMGVIGRDQVAHLDCTIHHWWRARRNGRWTALSPRVLRLDGTTETDGQRALAAVLDAGAGAVLHGCSSLAWFGLPRFDLSRIHVARPRGTTTEGCSLAVVHRLRDVRPHDLVVVRGVPTMAPLRAIWSEASRYSSERLYERGLQRIGRLLDDAHTRKLVRWVDLHETVDELQRSGRAGTRIMRELAAERPPGSSPTESRNEDRLEEILREAGAAPLERQPVVGGHAPIGRTDHRDPCLPLVIETNSLAFHSTLSDQRADEIRYAALVEAGFTVGVVWENDLWSHRQSVIELVSAARSRARRGDHGVLHSASCPWPCDLDRLIIGTLGSPYRG